MTYTDLSSGVYILKEFLSDLFEKEGMVMVAGHPGTGKTLLASTVCYEKARNGHRCLYVSLQEDKEKLYLHLSNVGIDFNEVEKKGLLKHIRIPVFSEEEVVPDFIETISRCIAEFKPNILVVDSVTPVLDAVGSDVRARAYLQNFFYEVARVFKGVVILVAEIPIGDERVGAGGVEFVADAILVMKQRVEKGLLTRSMEVRKVRGAPLTVAEIPYSIQPKKGLLFIPPYRLGEVKETLNNLTIPCDGLRQVLRDLWITDHIYYEYPAEYRALTPALLIPLIWIANELKVLLISYRYPEDVLLKLLSTRLAEAGAQDEVVRWVMEKLAFKSINPFMYSLVELNALENSLVDQVKPSMVVFHGVEVLMNSEPNVDKYFTLLYNQSLLMKRLGVSMTRFSSFVNEEYSRISTAVADIVIKVRCGELCIDHQAYVWRRFGEPMVLKPHQLETCLKQVLEYLNSRIVKSAK
ncbi:MAG: ATPase domain-containing protein [Zestosphaera sp.]